MPNQTLRNKTHDEMCPYKGCPADKELFADIPCSHVPRDGVLLCTSCGLEFNHSETWNEEVNYFPEPTCGMCE